MKARLVGMLVAAMAVTVVAVGCGGGSPSGEGSSGSAEPTSAPDQTAFVGKANSVCREARKGAFERLEAYEQKHRSEGLSEAALAEQGARVVLLSTIGAEVAGIRALGSSAGDEQEIEAIVSEMQKTLDEAKKNKKMPYTEIEGLFASTDKTLREHGLTGCTKNS